MLPEFAGFQAWAQSNGESILITVLIAVAIVLLIKREIGALIGVVIVIGIMIVVVNNPDATIVRIAQGVVDKIMGTGGQ